jgi:hypothetical protein
VDVCGSDGKRTPGMDCGAQLKVEALTTDRFSALVLFLYGPFRIRSGPCCFLASGSSEVIMPLS